MALTHRRVYFEAFGVDEGDFVDCECCDGAGSEIHHVFRRGMGGSKEWDFIENLMALCRGCHEEFGDITDLRPYLVRIHELRMQAAGIEYDKAKLEWVINGRQA